MQYIRLLWNVMWYRDSLTIQNLEAKEQQQAAYIKRLEAVVSQQSSTISHLHSQRQQQAAHTQQLKQQLQALTGSDTTQLTASTQQPDPEQCAPLRLAESAQLSEHLPQTSPGCGTSQQAQPLHAVDRCCNLDPVWPATPEVSCGLVLVCFSRIILKGVEEVKAFGVGIPWKRKKRKKDLRLPYSRVH
eukprot:scaffold256097_cov21-Tisochrysis_lutea.AAC.1